MLKVRYEIATNKMTGWCAFKENWDNLIAGKGEDIVWLENYNGVPSMETDFYFLNDVKDTIIANPNYIPPEPPRSTHISVLKAVDPTKARLAKVKRVWEGRDYFYDCFATQTVKDEYVTGKIIIGDYVLVHFDDIGEQIVTAKVFKSW